MNLRPYQERGKSNIINRPSNALFFPLGYGKTRTVLSAVHDLMWDYLTVQKVLVLAPKRVALIEWPSQLQREMPGTQYVVVHSDKANQIRQKVQFYFMSYSSLAWYYREALNNPKGLPEFDMVVYDEGTFLKSPSSTRWKICETMFKNIKRKVLLAGKPAPNGLLDLWGQIYLLDGGERLFGSLENFRTCKFIVTGGDVYKRYEPMRGTADWVAEQLADLVTTIRPEEKLQLPELIPVEIVCELSPSQRKKYDRLEKRDIFDGSEFKKICDNPASSLMSLRQMAQGFVYAGKEEPDLPAEEVHDHKIEAVQEIYDSSAGSNILIAVQFIEDVKRLQARFNCPAIYSKTSDSDTASYISQWNAGKLPMLAVHPASVSHGMNLQSGGNIVIWFGLPWDLDHYDQLNGRLHRSGQDKVVRVYHIIMKDTIDEVIMAVLRRKDVTQTALLSSLAEYVAKKSNGGAI